MSKYKGDNARRSSDIEAELAKLGVTELSNVDVVEQFPDTISRDLNVKVPSNANGVKWFLDANYTRTYNGTSYNVAVLRAMPNGSLNSPLLKETSEIRYTNKSSFAAAKKNLFKYVVNSGVGSAGEIIANEIPIVGTALSVYDAIKSVTSDIKTTTTITEITATASVLAGTGVKFVYVNKANNPSDYQELQLVTTMVAADGDWKVPSCVATDTSFSVRYLKGSNSLTSYDSHYNSSASDAVTYYAKGYSPRCSYVSADLSLLEGKVLSIPTATPRYPIHLM